MNCWRVTGLDFLFCLLFCCIPSVQYILQDWTWEWKASISFVIVITSLASAIKIEKLLRNLKGVKNV